MLQGAFNFPEIQSYTIDDFIVSENNVECFKKIINWPDSWNHKNFPYSLMLCGNNKSGKTHLANIWLQIARATPFASHQTIESLDERSNILVEDIENPKWSQTDLLYIFNFCHETKRYCLFTSASRSHDFSLPDLASRIKSIEQVSIKTPNHDEIKVILHKEFSKKSLLIEPKTIDLLSDILPLNFNSAIKAVELIDKTSLGSGKHISQMMIRKLFLND